MEEQSVNRQFPYFKHYLNARQDCKITRLLRKEGMEGIGIFWSLLELLGSAKDFRYQRDYEDLAFTFHVAEDKVKRVIENYDLFILDDDYFYSRSFSDQMDGLIESHKRRAAAGSLGGKKKAENIRNRSNATNNDSNAVAEPKQCSSNTLEIGKISTTSNDVAESTNPYIEKKKKNFIEDKGAKEKEEEKEIRHYDDRISDEKFIRIVKQFMYRGASEPSEEAICLIGQFAPSWIYEKDGRDFTGREEATAGFRVIPRDRKYISSNRLTAEAVRRVDKFVEILEKVDIPWRKAFDYYRTFYINHETGVFTLMTEYKVQAEYFTKDKYYFPSFERAVKEVFPDVHKVVVGYFSDRPIAI